MQRPHFRPPKRPTGRDRLFGYTRFRARRQASIYCPCSVMWGLVNGPLIWFSPGALSDSVRCELVVIARFPQYTRFVYIYAAISRRRGKAFYNQQACFKFALCELEIALCVCIEWRRLCGLSVRDE